MNPFYIAIFADGALYGGSENPNALERAICHEIHWAVIEMKPDLPKELREHCENHGTREQWFSDAYEGYNAVQDYIQAIWDTSASTVGDLRYLCIPDPQIRLLFNL